MWSNSRGIVIFAASAIRRSGGWSGSKCMPRRGYAEGGRASEKPKPSAAVTEELSNAWDGVAPLLDFPHVPSNFLKDRPPVPATTPAKLILNFVMPRNYEIESEEVDMVSIPTDTGLMGVLPAHVPTIANLKTGVLSVHNGAEVRKYVVSGGYAFVHANSVADVIAVEAFPPENLDIEEAKKGLAEYTTKLNSANTDLEKAEAQIAIEVYSHVVAALS